MQNKVVKCDKQNISKSNVFTLIAGPCQLENEKHAIDVAAKLKEITDLKVTNIDNHGINGDLIEAQMFGYLAVRSIPSNINIVLSILIIIRWIYY